MSIFKPIKKIFNPEDLRTRETVFDYVWDRFSPYSSGRGHGILKSFGKSPATFSAINMISNRVSAAQWYVFRPMLKNGKPAVDIYQPGAEEREIEGHPVIDLMNNFNDDMPGVLGWYITSAIKELVGSCYWIVKKDGNIPTEIYPMLPEWMQKRNAGGYEFKMPDNVVRTIPEENVIRIWTPDPSNPYGNGGIGIANVLADEISAHELTTKFENAFFENSGPEKIMTFEGISNEEVERLKLAFKNEYTGFKKAWKNAIFNVKADVQQLGYTFNDMQFSELKSSSIDTITQTFGIPPELLGKVDNSNRATIQAAETIFARNVLNPRLNQYKSSIQKLMKLYPQGDSLVLSYRPVVQEDKEFKLEVMKANAAAFTRDQWLMMAGFDPVGDDTRYVPINIMEQKNITKGVTKQYSISDDKLTEILRTEIDADLMLNSLDPRYRTIFISVMNDTMGTLAPGVSVDPYSMAADKYISGRVADNVVKITRTMRDDIKAAVTEGITEGEEWLGVARRIEDKWSTLISKSRIDTIARTESHNTTSFATLEAYNQSGVVKGKEWIHQPQLSKEPRGNHAALDGQIVQSEEPFVSAFGSAQYPGGFGIAEEDINCNCVIAAVVQDEAGDLKSLYSDKDKRAQYWEKQIGKVKNYETKFKDIYTELMRKYKNNVIKALEVGGER